MQSEEYVKKDLARGVDYIGVCCAFLCHDGAGNFLFHKRSDACRDERGVWDCGGGALEFGESFEDAVRREVMEEYGVEPFRIDYTGSHNVVRMNNGARTHWVSNMHLVQVPRADVIKGEPEKMEEMEWFRLDALPMPLHSQVMHSITAARRFLQNNA